MKTEQENILTLPRSCFGVLVGFAKLIRIDAGGSGYYPTDYPDHWLKEKQQELKDKGLPFAAEDVANAIANDLNEKDGISIQQRKAMEWGSMFGWGHSLAMPENYDQDGKPYSASNPRPTV